VPAYLLPLNYPVASENSGFTDLKTALRIHYEEEAKAQCEYGEKHHSSAQKEHGIQRTGFYQKAQEQVSTTAIGAAKIQQNRASLLPSPSTDPDRDEPTSGHR